MYRKYLKDSVLTREKNVRENRGLICVPRIILWRREFRRPAELPRTFVWKICDTNQIQRILMISMMMFWTLSMVLGFWTTSRSKDRLFLSGHTTVGISSVSDVKSTTNMVFEYCSVEDLKRIDLSEAHERKYLDYWEDNTKMYLERIVQAIVNLMCSAWDKSGCLLWRR